MTEAVTDYLESRLSWWDRVRFQMHLGICWHCRAYLRQMRTLVRTLHQMPPIDPPAAVRVELLRRFRDWKKTSE